MPDLAIRKLDPATLERFRRGAAARGITQAEYLERLLTLHEFEMAMANRELPAMGLEPVTA